MVVFVATCHGMIKIVMIALSAFVDTIFVKGQLNSEWIYSRVKKYIKLVCALMPVYHCHKPVLLGKWSSLIEILWSNLTLEQNSSWIWLSASTPMLVLSRPEYSELALECRQQVKSKNYFAQVSNSTTKFLSV